MLGRRHTEESKRLIREHSVPNAGQFLPGNRRDPASVMAQRVTMSIFSKEDILKMVAMRKSGYKRRELAGIFNVSYPTVRNILLGTTYPHVDREYIQ